MKNKHIAIGVTGSVSAYKAAEMASRLKQDGADIYTVMTENALEFIGRETFSALTGNPVLCEMFTEKNLFASSDHVGLSEWMDVLVIAPATANIIGKIANGIADDLLSTIALSTDRPILIAPAMNEKMYLNSAVRENIKILKKRGYHIIEPETGFLACGLIGKGRLADTDKIIAKIKGVLK